jgi:hypothetical protein
MHHFPIFCIKIENANLPHQFLVELFPVEPVISQPNRRFPYSDLESQEVEYSPEDCLPMWPVAKNTEFTSFNK